MELPYTAPSPFTSPFIGPSERSKLVKPRHTIEDLLSIELKPSTWIIKPFSDAPPVPKSLDIDRMMKGAFRKYLILSIKTPPLNQKLFDRLRYKLHLKLLEWGVIV